MTLMGQQKHNNSLLQKPVVVVFCLIIFGLYNVALTGVMSSAKSFRLTGYVQMTVSITFRAVLRRVYLLHIPLITFWHCNWSTAHLRSGRRAGPTAAISDFQNL